MESTKDRAASLRVIYIEFLDEVVSLSEHNNSFEGFRSYYKKSVVFFITYEQVRGTF